MSDDRLQEAHNRGQGDAGDNRYDPPHDTLDFIVARVSEMDQMIAENEAYDKGYENGKS